jgi:uncharacterized protein
MKNIERRDFAIEGLKVERRDGEPAKIVGHAAVFNSLSEDLGGFRETILPGAFSDAITRDDVRALINHDSNLILGRNRAGTLTLSEDERGLLVEITPPDTSYARDLMVSMERGDINQMSFGFSVAPGGSSWGETTDGVYVRTLSKCNLFDVSPVTYPAYPQTDVALRSLSEFREAEKKPEDTGWRVKLMLRALDLIA